jgi:hypothetical protein
MLRLYEMDGHKVKCFFVHEILTRVLVEGFHKWPRNTCMKLILFDTISSSSLMGSLYPYRGMGGQLPLNLTKWWYMSSNLPCQDFGPSSARVISDGMPLLRSCMCNAKVIHKAWTKNFCGMDMASPHVIGTFLRCCSFEIGSPSYLWCQL